MELELIRGGVELGLGMLGLGIRIGKSWGWAELWLVLELGLGKVGFGGWN